MKKIGLATCYLDNYGACLQAHALQHVIEQGNFSCEIINFVEPYGYPHRNSWRGKVRNCYLVRKLYAAIKPNYRTKFMEEERFNQFRKQYLHIAQATYETTDELINNPPMYDAYVCGSDQIWNPEFYDCNNQAYFLNFAPLGKKRVAYAPSIGLAEFPGKYAQEFKTLVQALDTVSVREEEGAKIIEQITGRQARVVLDPTLLCSSSYWKAIVKPVKVDEAFIFFYTFGNKPYMHKFIERVQRKTRMPVLYTSFTEWGSQINSGKSVSGIGPSEFLWLIKNAKLVVTDSFHATAFSINFNTPFYTMLRNSDDEKINMNSRIFSILEMTGLNARIVNEIDVTNKEIEVVMDFGDANSRLTQRRQADTEFLYCALR